MTILADLSDTVIANMAVDILEESTIENINMPTTSVGRFMLRNYGLVRDQLLQAYPWSFARWRELLSKDPTAPAFGWAYRYALPSDYLATVSLTASGLHNGYQIKHEVEGGYILTDQSAPLYLRYVRKRTNPLQFPPLFAGALAARLALFAAQRVTGKSSYVDKAAAIYKDFIVEARLADSLSAGTIEDMVRHDIIDIRGVGPG